MFSKRVNFSSLFFKVSFPYLKGGKDICLKDFCLFLFYEQGKAIGEVLTDADYSKEV